MNAIIFIVDDYDRVLKCICTHDINDSKFYTIEMEPGRLNSLLRLFADEYKQIDEKINKNAIILTFYDVDDDALTELVKMSNEYRKKLERIRAKAHQEKRYQTQTIDYTCDNEYIKDKNKTVSRKKSNFKTTVVKFTLLTLSTIMLLSVISKAHTKSTTNVDINPPISYAQNIEIKDDINKEFRVTIPPVVDIKEEKDTTTPTLETKTEEEKINPFTLETEDLTNSEKYQSAKENYFNLIEKYATEYGLDPMLMLAIATQERGVHSETVDPDGGLGLFQIQIEGGWNWDNETISAYNFRTNEEETITITKDKVRNLEFNIKCGCILFQNALREQNYNIPRAIQCYNYGSAYMDQVVSECCRDTGYSRNDISDPTNLIWTNYRSVIKNGDNRYLENVLRYLPNDTQLEFKKPSGEKITMTFENETFNDSMRR